MAKEKDYVRSFYHVNLAKEIARVLLECNKMGIFIGKKEVTAVIAEKSRRSVMSKIDIENYIKQIKGITKWEIY